MITLWQDYVGDGITWPVVEGCDQFTLTVYGNELRSLYFSCCLMFDPQTVTVTL